ncbi:MAG: leucine-rich repeat domain-containing protein, partial [Clostridia bacterium]|nr:leucine-rich repeat domain-containing protein [Clostridia bacterium]
IGGRTFKDCSSLTDITIPDSVTRIFDWAFFGCSSLTGITIPDSVTSIGNLVFSSCSSLTYITIPDSVASIGYRAFDGCCSLTVYCSEGSCAWRYCKENKIKHKPLSKAPAKLSSAPRNKPPARWLVPLLILLALAVAAGLQLSGLVDIIGLLGL